jgi:predicted RNase H-like HicB family nuclease
MSPNERLYKFRDSRFQEYCERVSYAGADCGTNEWMELGELGANLSALVTKADDSCIIVTHDDDEVAVILAPARYNALVARAGVTGTAELPVLLEEDESGMFVASCPSIPGCLSQGSTEEDALDKIREAITGCLETRRELNMTPTLHTVKVVMRRDGGFWARDRQSLQGVRFRRPQAYSSALDTAKAEHYHDPAGSQGQEALARGGGRIDRTFRTDAV